MKGWKRHVCFSTKCSGAFKSFDIFVELNQKNGMQTKRLWFIFDPSSQGAASDHNAKKGIWVCNKINLNGFVLYQPLDSLWEKEMIDPFQQDCESTC